MVYLIFVDECGYSPDWQSKKNIEEQPVYILSGVAVSSEKIHTLYQNIRQAISSLNLPDIKGALLGNGEEIKAKDVDRGEGFWEQNPDLRNEVRRIYLDLSDVTYFIVAIDKQKHKMKYPNPKDPSEIAFQYLLERVQGFLSEQEKYGLVLIDSNKCEEEDLRRVSSKLLPYGSSGLALDRLYGRGYYEWSLKIENVLEIHFGDSRYSLGLQIADFVARHAYSHWKKGKTSNYPGWSYIEPRLYKYPNYKGWGYKEFPE